jgi:hypothetical protein
MKFLGVVSIALLSLFGIIEQKAGHRVSQTARAMRFDQHKRHLNEGLTQAQSNLGHNTTSTSAP